MSDIPLGIDISKETFVASLPEGLRESFPNDPEQFEQFKAWLEAHDLELARLHVCMETTGTYSLPLAAWLVSQGVQVSVVNPSRIQGFAQGEFRRNKTDWADARLIAHFCRVHEPDEWTPEDEVWRELKQLTRRVLQLKRMRTQERNRLQTPAGSEACEASQQSHIDFIQEEIEGIWQRIEALIASHPKLQEPLKWLTSIPGLGRQTSIVLMAEIQDIERFASAKKLAAYAGVTPENRQSGQWSGSASMSKRGSARLRQALYMPAMTAQTHNPIVESLCERLEERGKDSMAIVGAAMHKLIRLVYGVWSNEKRFDPEYAA